MRVTVISPERSLFDGEAQSVVAPAFDGFVGILPQHAPFLTLLGSGVLTIEGAKSGDGVVGTQAFHVSGGFLQVRGDHVRAVADRGEPARPGEGDQGTGGGAGSGAGGHALRRS